MRLIDADATLRGIDTTIALLRVASGSDQIKNKAVDMVQHTRNFVANMETVDAVPVVHGRWIGSYDFCCSVCGVYQNCYTGQTNYCPNCGARMDLKEV